MKLLAKIRRVSGGNPKYDIPYRIELDVNYEVGAKLQQAWLSGKRITITVEE